MRVAGLTIAVEQPEPMVAFYNAVFACGLKPFEAFGVTLYRGQLAGLPLVFCPNDVAGASPGQGKHQLRIAAADVVACVEAALLAGGATIGELTQAAAGIRDPDGNTIEIIAAPAG